MLSLERRCLPARLRAEERINREVAVRRQRNRVGQCGAMGLFRDQSHDRSENGATNDGHHEQRTADFGVQRLMVLKSNLLTEGGASSNLARGATPYDFANLVETPVARISPGRVFGDGPSRSLGHSAMLRIVPGLLEQQRQSGSPAKCVATVPH
jgi:hypothetical protein